MERMPDGNTAALNVYLSEQDACERLHADYASAVDDAIREVAEDEMARGDECFADWLAEDAQGLECAVRLALVSVAWHDRPTAQERRDVRAGFLADARCALEDAYVEYRQRDDDLRADRLAFLTEGA